MANIHHPRPHSAALLAAIAVLSISLSGPVFAQGTQQTVSLMKVDLATLATGYRTSKLVGSQVYNEANESVGAIDDLIVTSGDKIPYAVLSVGGFLGIDSKLIVVPYAQLEVHDKRMVLPGATKASLQALPQYKYVS